MKRFRPALLFFVLLVAVPVVVLAIQTQRAQIFVGITIFVTPAPLAYVHRSPAVADPQMTKVITTLREVALGTHPFRAQNVRYIGDVVAQSQGAIRVEATVTPNPNATLLVSNQTGVTISQTAGTTQAYSCIYSVTVDTTVTNWTLNHGLYSDFYALSGSHFAGGLVANNSYLSTPHPTATPFVVYSDDGNAWATLSTGSASKTFCVDLTVTIPSSTPGGAYESNATYTLLY